MTNTETPSLADQVDAMAYAHKGLAAMRRTDDPSPVELHEDDSTVAHEGLAHDTIVAELRACTLGARGPGARPELRTDLAGKLGRIMRRLTEAMRPVVEAHQAREARVRAALR